MHTTLHKIRARRPDKGEWRKLLKHVGKTRADHVPLPIARVLDSNGVMNALCCFRTVEGHDRTIRLFALWCGNQARHLVVTDRRCLEALGVLQRHVDGMADDDALRAARKTAYAAVQDASRAAWMAAASVPKSTRNRQWEAAWDKSVALEKTLCATRTVADATLEVPWEAAFAAASGLALAVGSSIWNPMAVHLQSLFCDEEASGKEQA